MAFGILGVGMDQALAATLMVFGGLVCLISLLAVLFPVRIGTLARRVTITTPLRIVAAGIRIGVGAVSLAAARLTRFPLTLEIIGVLLVASGIGVLLAGNRRLQRIIDWFLGFGAGAIRGGGVAGLLFGAFLIYVSGHLPAL